MQAMFVRHLSAATLVFKRIWSLTPSQEGLEAVFGTMLLQPLLLNPRRSFQSRMAEKGYQDNGPSPQMFRTLATLSNCQ